jgi:hypothetical protein
MISFGFAQGAVRQFLPPSTAFCALPLTVGKQPRRIHVSIRQGLVL